MERDRLPSERGAQDPEILTRTDIRFVTDLSHIGTPFPYCFQRTCEEEDKVECTYLMLRRN